MRGARVAIVSAAGAARYCDLGNRVFVGGEGEPTAARAQRQSMEALREDPGRPSHNAKARLPRF